MALTKIGTDGVKDDAVTSGKIPANAVGSSEIATDAVTGDGLASNSVNTTHLVDTSVITSKIADQAVTLDKLPHGTSSNDGKFLRANNGADPSFETVSIPAGTTINNNADNRVITGSGTANTLEGEAGFTFVAGSDPNLTLSGSGHPRINLTSTSGSDHTGINFGDNDDINAGMIQYTNSNNAMQFHTNGGEKVRIDSTGRITQNGTTSADTASSLTLQNGASGNEHTILELIADPNHYSMIYLGASDDRYRGQIRYKDNDHFMSFHTNNTERLRIQSGGGISFNGDSAAANALDDYEEGSWTPVAFGWSQSGTNSYGNQNGRYIKVGNLVTVFFFVEWTNLSNASGVLAIGGFPYNHRTSTYNGSTAVECRYIDYSGDTVYGVYGNGYGTSILLYAQTDNGNPQYVGIDGAGMVEGTISYLAG